MHGVERCSPNEKMEKIENICPVQIEEVAKIPGLLGLLTRAFQEVNSCRCRGVVQGSSKVAPRVMHKAEFRHCVPVSGHAF